MEALNKSILDLFRVELVSLMILFSPKIIKIFLHLILTIMNSCSVEIEYRH